MNTPSISAAPPTNSWTSEEEIYFSFKQKNEKTQAALTQFQFTLDANRHARFFEVAKTNNTVSLVVLFSAFSVLLKKYSFQKNIVIHTPHLAGVENDPLRLALSLYIDTNRSFKAHLKMCQETLKEQYSKQKQDLLNKKSRSNVLFIYENAHDQALLTGIDFIFKAAMQEEQLQISISYHPACYDAAFIQRIPAHFDACLALFQQPDTLLKDCDILPETEAHTIFTQFNNTAKTYDSDKTLIELFEEKAKNNPDKNAIWYQGESLTYQQLNNHVNTLADYLQQEYELPTGTCIAVMLERSTEWLIALLAIWKCGATYVPLDLKLTVEQRDTVLAKTNTKVLITISDLMFELQDYEENLLAIDLEITFDDTEPLTFSNQSSAEQTAYIIRTSGSTGEPKTIPITHKSIADRMLYHLDYLELEQHNVLQFASLSFDASLVEIFMALIAGNTLVIASEREKNDTNVLTQLLATHEVNVAIFPPSYLKILQKRDLPSLQKIITTGEKASIPDCIHYAQSKEVYNGYGPTETCIGASFYKINYEHRDYYTSHSIPIGQPFANTKILLLDEDRRLTPVGLQGEICVAGLGLSEGYLNDPALTAEKFITTTYLDGARLYTTGDYASFTEEGTLLFKGRLDSQVQLNGIRVELQEIEAAINTHPAVKNTVVSLEEMDSGKKLIAFVEKEGEVNAATLTNHLAKILPQYMRPNSFVLLDIFPLNNAGKIDLPALKQHVQLAEEEASTKEIIAPTTELEKHIVAIFQNILLHQPLSITDSFFAYGGNSLKAIQVVSEVYKLTGITIDVRDIFDHPTPQSLAQHAETLSTEEELIPVISREDQLYDISFNQKRFLGFEKSFRAMSKDQKPNNAFPGTFTIKGDLQVEAFEKALRYLVQRHESLRTLFVEIGDELKQQIFETADRTFSFQYHDLSQENDPQIKADELLDLEDKTSIDLFEGPLLRIRLLKKSATEHLLILVIHHIVSDGWSMNILFDELFATYNNFCQGKAADLKPLPIHYKEFAYWKNDKINSGALDKDQAFWFDYLAGVRQIDFPHTVVQKEFNIYNGFDHEIEMDEALTQQLKTQAIAYNTTIFTFLVASLQLLIHAITKEEDVAIASVNAGREHKDLNPQIGYYANDTIFRTQIEGGLSASDYLQQVKRNLLDVFSHQNYPYSLLVEQLKFEECPIGIGIENFTKVSNNTQMEGLSFSTESSSVHKWFGRSFSFNFTEREKTLALKLIYNSNRFTEQDARTRARQYVQVLQFLLHSEEQKLSEIINRLNPAS